jgi:hypothetical protein
MGWNVTTANGEQPKRFRMFRNGGWVFCAAGLLTVLAALQVFWPVITGRRIRSIGNGKDVATYQFNMGTSLIPKSDIVASGIVKDGLRAMVDPPMWTVAQNMAMDKQTGRLVSGDLVIGVAAGDEARAYPLSTLELHEIVNDKLGGRYITVTYNPLCGSCVVFERKDPNIVFGVSGLLYQSNLLMYDRAVATREPHEGSLWSQLQFRAVTGPAAANKQKLTLFPFQLTTWANWKKQHANTVILARDPSLSEQYYPNRYGSYFASDEIKFPVDPMWKDAELARKTRVLAVRVGDQWTVYTLPKLIEAAGKSGRWTTTQGGVALEFAVDGATESAYLVTPSGPPADVAAVPCLLFAWYAQHPDGLRLVR